MAHTPNGGPAFPWKSEWRSQWVDTCRHSFTERCDRCSKEAFAELDRREREESAGMSLRDYFAAKALPQAIAAERELRASMIKPDDFRFDAVAETAYLMAEAMLKARSK